jgi:hypothetical protein
MLGISGVAAEVVAAEVVFSSIVAVIYLFS